MRVREATVRVEREVNPEDLKPGDIFELHAHRFIVRATVVGSDYITVEGSHRTDGGGCVEKTLEWKREARVTVGKPEIISEVRR